MKTIFLFFISFQVSSQAILVYGNKINLEKIEAVFQIYYSDSIPDSLENYKAILIFSTGSSQLDAWEELSLQNYLLEGGNLYLGAENYPFVEECNQLTNRFFQLKAYGNFETDTLIFKEKNILQLENSKVYYSGVSTVSFPLDYRLKVEAWSDDNPIILSGDYGKGKIILDGGYSRFYTFEKNEEILEKIMAFLLK